MARGIDFSALTGAERSVIASGILLFANGFIPWWYRIPGHTYNAGLTGWSTLAVAAGALAALAVLVRAMVWPEPAPRADGLVYMILGVLSLTSLLAELTTEHGEWIGLYVGIVLALLLTGAGMRRRRERRSGWI